MLPRITHRYWPRWQAVVKCWQEDEVSLLAASVSYYAALSFFPLLLILTAGMGLFLEFSGWGQDAQHRLLDFIGSQTSTALARQVEQILAEVRTRAIIGGPVGLLVLLFAAITIFYHVELSFERIWRVPGQGGKGILAAIRDVLFHRLRAFLMLLSVGLLVICNFISGMALSTVTALTNDLIPQISGLWRFAPIVLSVALNFLAFTLVYKTLSKGPVRWKEASDGGLIAAIVWEIGRQTLAALVIGDKYGAYGVIGSFIALMLWVYYSSAVVFLGAEYVKVVCLERIPNLLTPTEGVRQIPRVKRAGSSPGDAHY